MAKTAVTLAVLATGIFGSAAVTAAHASSYFGTFGQGYDDGKRVGEQEFGTSTDATCPGGNSFTYCLGYHAGFDEEQAALQAAQR
jgi:hypothetical protein